MTVQFWLGLATIPALAALIYGVYILWHLASHTLTTWHKPWWTVDDRSLNERAYQAAGVAWARRSWHVYAPFGVVIIYRTVDDRRTTASEARSGTWLRFLDVMKDVRNRELQKQEVDR